jgi:hypothetical protein
MEFVFCKGMQRQLVVANFDGRDGADLMCLHKGSRKFELLSSSQVYSGLQEGQKDFPVEAGDLSDFCSQTGDYLVAGGDFDGDGLGDLICRQLGHTREGDRKIMGVKFGKLM